MCPLLQHYAAYNGTSVPDVSGQLIGLIFKGQEIQE
jgi:hypothetical protein